MIDADTSALVQRHHDLALRRWNSWLGAIGVHWPGKEDPNNYFADIQELAELLCDGDDTAAGNLADDINKAHERLTTNVELGFGDIAYDLRDWEGDGARSFNNYLGEVKQAIGRYEDVLHDFRQIQAGCEAMIAESKKNVRDLLGKAITAQQEGSAQDWTVVLTVVGAVAGAVGSIAGGGGIVWLVVTGAVLASGTSVATAEISTDGPGETAKSLRDGLLALMNDVIDQRDRFYSAIKELDEYITGANLPYVDPSPPPFVTAPKFDPHTFELPDYIEPPGIENNVSQDPLVKPAPTANSKISATLDG